MAGDERRFVRGDEDDRVGKLFREAEATHRNTRHQSRLVLRRARKTGQHARVRRARGHGVDTNSRFGDLERHRFGDAFDGVLAADIDGGACRALVAVGRGDIDDAPAALCLHDAHLVLDAQDHAENIRVERRGIAFRGLVGDRADLAFGASIVHRDIETAKPCDGLIDQSADVILLADVGIDKLGLRTERAQLLYERLARLITPTRNDHLRALLGKGDGGRAPDPAQSAGDQYDWVAHFRVPHGFALLPPEHGWQARKLIRPTDVFGAVRSWGT